MTTHDPFEPTPAPADPEARARQVADLETLRRAAMSSVHSFAIDHRTALAKITDSDHAQLLVHTALAFLLAQGMIAITAAETWPPFYPIDWQQAIPEHLRPDIRPALEFADGVRTWVAMHGGADV